MQKQTVPESIETIEKEIASSIRHEGKTWKLTYVLIKKVEDERVWETAKHKSFSEWMKHVADKYCFSESALWKTKMSGDIYMRYAESALKNGEYAVPFSDSSLAMDSLIYLNRMGQGDRKCSNSLISYAQMHRVSKSDLRTAWQATKRQMEKAGISAVKRSRYDEYYSLPDEVKPLEILKQTVYPQTRSKTLTDREIVQLVRQYMGASIYRSSLENALREYTNTI